MNCQWPNFHPTLMACTLKLHFQLHPPCKDSDTRNWVKVQHHCIVRATDPSDARTQVMGALHANLGSGARWELASFNAVALSEVYQPANCDLPWDLTVNQPAIGGDSAPVPC